MSFGTAIPIPTGYDPAADAQTVLSTIVEPLAAEFPSVTIRPVVLDRPNPISGDPASLEGAPQEAGFLSFVGLEPLPVRHALTLGEVLALFFERDGHPLGPEGALSIAPVLGWERYRTALAWGRPFVMPSPNMPSLETALVYPGGCLVEGTNLSEGRGTTAPFQIVGAPSSALLKARNRPSGDQEIDVGEDRFGNRLPRGICSSLRCTPPSAGMR